MPDPIVRLDAEHHIPVARPYLAGRNGRYFGQILSRAWISGGAMVERFEREFSASHSPPDVPVHGVACNSGTTALHLALVGAGVGSGDVVALPTLTMVAVANAVLYCGAVPYFVDSNLADGNLNWHDAGHLVRGTCAKLQCKTAIIPHLYGSVSDANRFIRDILRADGPVIQDCAECHYATHEGTLVRHRNDILTFSFYANKIIACGEGGMVVTQRADIADRLRRLRAHAFTPGDHFNHSEMAFGYRMTDMQAALGLAQHSRRNRILRFRRNVAERYRELLSDVQWIEFPHRSPGSVWWVYPILIRRDSSLTVEAVREALAEGGVETRRYFKPLHTQAHLTKYVRDRQNFPVACDLYARGLYLPLYPGLSREHAEHVAAILRSI